MIAKLETDKGWTLAPVTGGPGRGVMEVMDCHPAFASDSQTRTFVAKDPVRVLIVDDAPSTRRLLRAVLESCRDFDVVGEASDGRGAVEMAQALQPDLVLLDLFMPFLDGTRALRHVLDGAPHTKVIVVSGMKSAKEAQLLEAGAVGFVAKGFTPGELLKRLGEILGGLGSN